MNRLLATALVALLAACHMNARSASPLALLTVQNSTAERLRVYLIANGARVRPLGDVDAMGNLAVILHTSDAKPGAPVAFFARGTVRNHASEVVVLWPGNNITWAIRERWNVVAPRFAVTPRAAPEGPPAREATRTR